MTDEEKICPFMSRPIHYPGKKSFSSGVIHCQKEYCMAWGNTAAYDKTGKKTEPNPGCRLIP